MSAGSGWHRRAWSEADEAYLREHYGAAAARSGGLTELAAHFHRDRKSVREKARRMGLRNSPGDVTLRARFSQLPAVDPIRHAWEALHPDSPLPARLNVTDCTPYSSGWRPKLDEQKRLGYLARMGERIPNHYGPRITEPMAPREAIQTTHAVEAVRSPLQSRPIASGEMA